MSSVPPTSVPPRPSASGAGTAPPGGTASCPPCCPPMEIEVNDTPATDDDYVQVPCTQPAGRHTVPCRIRATASSPGPCTVVLTNPDGRLRFPGVGDVSTTVSVPNDGSWVSFSVSGETGSQALNDAVIEAHCQTATGPLLARKPMTVFWFDDVSMNVTVGGNYALTAGRYTVTGANAVNLSASARIRPAGANCAAPQIRNLRVGLMQNTFPPRGRVTTWTNPTIAWSPGVAAGTVANVPTTMHVTIAVTASANDSEASVDPLYDQPGKTGTLDANSLKPPVGCPGGGAATSADTPSTPLPPTLQLPVQSGGVTVGQVTWSQARLVHTDHFTTWAVLFDTAANTVCAIRQRTWTLNLDSSAATPQRPQPAAADQAPSTAMVTSPPYSNTRSNDPANRSSGAVGLAVTTFTHP